MRIVALSLFLLVANEHAYANPCVDSSTFRFTIIKDGKKVKRECKWLKNEVRRKKFCHKTFKDLVIGNECPLSCGSSYCQTAGPLSCVDSNTYTLTTTSNGESVERKCTWLSRMKYRQDKFCDENINGSIVKDQCRQSCSNCPDPASDVEFNCEDSTTYEFITYINGQAEYRKCDWISKKPFRADKFCGHTYFGSMVKDECIHSCDNCPSSQPSTGPSDQPTITPTISPTSGPSHDPSSLPSITPSVPPTVRPCLDSRTYRFETLSNGKVILRPCHWLTSRESLEAHRLAKFCTKFSNGSMVKDQCILSCSNCPTYSPSPSSMPSVRFSTAPSAHPTVQSSTKPSEIPTIEPTFEPTFEPTTLSSEAPSSSHTVGPSIGSSSEPTSMFSDQPSEGSSSNPSV